jgi:hypothetical protein
MTTPHPVVRLATFEDAGTRLSSGPSLRIKRSRDADAPEAARNASTVLDGLSHA